MYLVIEMTDKLYMINPYLNEIEANVLLNRKVGDKFHTILDKTIFYPDGVGGQRGDKGSINGIIVEKSIEKDGKIIHITDEKIPGSTALVNIDWENRFQIMQQHTAQHIVSSCFQRLFNIPTLSFHASNEFITIDLDTDYLELYETEKVEELANAIIQNNFLVKSYFPKKEEKETIDFRRIPKVEENLRVVEIDSIDYSACGGTHVNYTGEIGLIKITEIYKQNGKFRVKVLVGKDSLLDYSKKNKIFYNLAEKLSANSDNIIEKFDSYMESKNSLAENYISLKNSFFQLLKDKSLPDIINFGDSKLLIEKFDEFVFSETANYSKFFEEENVILILYNQNNELVQFLIKPCGNTSINMDLLMDNLKNRYNLKGGGNKKLLQGVIYISKDENIIDVFKNELEQLNK